MLTGLVGYVYAVVAGASDLVAGSWALRHPSGRIQPRYVIAFAAGALLAATFFHVLPEVDLRANASFMALGFLTFYVLEKVMMIHACGESECDTHRIGPVAVLGMALDNVVDGAGIVVGYHLDPLLGLAITFAVVLHEIPQGFTSAVIMREAGWSRKWAYGTLGIAGILYPIGALLAGLIPPALEGKLLAFIAGDFIYIGASDLLPEAHRRFNWKVVALVILGMVFMVLLKMIAPHA